MKLKDDLEHGTKCASESTKRIQFDFSVEALGAIDRAMKDAGYKTRAEALRKALRLFAFVLKKQSSGHQLCFKDEEGRVQEFEVFL